MIHPGNGTAHSRLDPLMPNLTWVVHQSRLPSKMTLDCLKFKLNWEDSSQFDGVDVGSQNETPGCLGSEASVTGLEEQGD